MTLSLIAADKKTNRASVYVPAKPFQPSSEGKKVSMDKHSSLFCNLVIDEYILYNTDTMCIIIYLHHEEDLVYLARLFIPV